MEFFGIGHGFALAVIVYSGSGCKDLRILNLGTAWYMQVSGKLNDLQVYARGKSCGVRSISGWVEE
jgi:hypothetical protein